MKRVIGGAILAAGLVFGSPGNATAHDLPWRAGEQRQIGFGHCAKGPCMKRASWSRSKPHRHVNGRVVLVQIASSTRD